MGMTAEAHRRIRTLPGVIYAVATEDGANIKVGYSTQLKARLKKIKTDHYYRWASRLLGSIEAPISAEKRLHKQLRALPGARAGTINAQEFYHATPEVLAMLRTLMPAIPEGLRDESQRKARAV